jgi:hypothetical protein
MRLTPAAALLGLLGCADGLTLQTLGVSAAAPVYKQPVVEIYSRIAKGANGCWLRPGGIFHGTHILHADVDPPSKSGGGAEIDIHERDTKGKDPRGVKVLKILIVQVPGGTAVDLQAARLGETLRAKVVSDAHRWAGGGIGCSLTDGWAPVASPAPPAKAKPVKGAPPAAKGGK